MPHQPASSALQRFRVIDLTQVRAGPTACRQLADWGADVIQVQMPESMRGDDTLGGQEGSDYQYTHRNKRSITLNLKTDEGIATLKRLIDGADVVVENFRPDVKFRLGIDYASLSATNPGLVYASISGFGQTGPLAARPGFDQIAQGMGGLMSVTGQQGDGPMRVGIPIADLCAGIFAAQGILVALLEREASGKGQFLHTSLLESMIYMLDFQTSRYLIDGEVACGLISNMKEALEEPQVQHLGMVKEVVSKWQGPQRLVGQPMQLERTPSTIARAAPRRGEHTEEILSELGLGADDLVRMKAAGVY